MAADKSYDLPMGEKYMLTIIELWGLNVQTEVEFKKTSPN